ncbi:MAG: aminotransferase class I/II-fold pyridoxal phosphate-dependent enzyme [Coriobacteriia bacterium]|nr:aminotransferase class I/II-fold pyridoxal phosphate-dependent enzyme [Coriobacteriia bacterium]MCL2750452.1 aminotransferase class I/II-fold pyridoxal phosphate-dependent enzyme [Coriobacteriia bacterium]
MTIYDYSPSTIAARVGTEVDGTYHSLGIPIYMTNNYVFDNAEEAKNATQSPEFGDCYTRISNPTNNELGKAVAALEGAEMGLPFASGAAAFSALTLTLLKAGDHVVCDDTCYAATNYLLSTLLVKFGVEVTMLDFTNYEGVQKALRPNTKLVYFETPCNPTMKVIDIARIVQIVKNSGSEALLVTDSTFATPFITKPLELGIDVVLHSSTKFICGHGDAVGGVLVGPQSIIEEIWTVGLKNLGGCASPFNSFLMLRGIKTLELRMEYSCKMALAVAQFLETHPKIERVNYPGLPSHPAHEVAKKQMKNFGALLTFEVKGGMEAGVALMNNVKLCALAVSLGEANTLVQHPASMTHWYVAEETRRASGITDGLIRFAAGLESINDIIADLDQALGGVKS